MDVVARAGKHGIHQEPGREKRILEIKKEQDERDFEIAIARCFPCEFSWKVWVSTESKIITYSTFIVLHVRDSNGMMGGEVGTSRTSGRKNRGLEGNAISQKKVVCAM